MAYVEIRFLRGRNIKDYVDRVPGYSQNHFISSYEPRFQPPSLETVGFPEYTLATAAPNFN